MGRLEGKRALITGSASGIGRATARLFANEGARLTLCDIKSKENKRLAEEIISSGGEALSIQTDVGDPEAMKTAFGDEAYKIKVSSTKSMTGHLLGAAGGVEAAIAVLAVAESAIPPTINLETPDPECDLDYTPHHAIRGVVKAAMSNNLGFGGHNASLIFKAV